MRLSADHWYSLCFWKLFLLYWKKKQLCLLRLFYVCIPDVTQVFGTKYAFYIARAFWCLWQFDQSTVQTAILITYHEPLLSVVLKALISLLDHVSQGKCCCDAAGGILSCSFKSVFGISLRTGSRQQCMLASRGAERSAAQVFAHINLQMLYPYVVILWLQFGHHTGTL